MAKKEFKWVDATGAPLQLGDWVVYLIPSARRLTMGPIMKGTDKSVSVLEISGAKHAGTGATWSLESTVARPFDMVVKIETPWKFIEESLDQRSGFCAGIVLGRKELQKVIHAGNSINIDDLIERFVDVEFPFTTFYERVWYQPPPFLESREKQIEMVRAGFNWYMRSQSLVP